jgi:hypothetical protein
MEDAASPNLSGQPIRRRIGFLSAVRVPQRLGFDHPSALVSLTSRTELASPVHSSMTRQSICCKSQGLELELGDNR